MASETRDLRVLNKLDRVRAARVLRNADIGEIDAAIIFEDDIFQNRAETQRLKNIRLAFRSKVDRLGVTTPFDIEDAVIRPDMLVITDQMTFRISGKCSLASPAETVDKRRSGALFSRRSGAMLRE